jgi:hypothetical protein
MLEIEKKSALQKIIYTAVLLEIERFLEVLS